MSTLYNSISFEPEFSRRLATNIFDSSSGFGPSADGAQSFGANTYTRTYNPIMGSFISQLIQDDVVPDPDETPDLVSAEPFAFYSARAFQFPIYEFNRQAPLINNLDNNGASGNQILLDTLPVTCKTTGIVYDNNVFGVNLGDDRWYAQYFTTNDTGEPIDNGEYLLGTNIIPSSNVLQLFNDPTVGELFMDFNAQSIPVVDPFLFPAGTYDFKVTNVLQFRILTPPIGGPIITDPDDWTASDIGFDARIEQWNPTTRALRVKFIPGTQIGQWSGQNTWRATNINSPDLVNGAINDIMHFEFVHSLYPVRALSSPNPATTFVTTGNAFQGVAESENITYESQLTYRKFWNPAFNEEAFTDDEVDIISNYYSNFQSNVQLNSPYNNNKAFTLDFNNSTYNWEIRGAFKRTGDIICRGYYEIY